MSYIQLNTPPPHESYSYKVEEDHLKSPTRDESKWMEYRIGNRIDPGYENGTKYTPVQKEKLYLYSGAALCAIAAVSVTFAAFATGMLPLLFIAIPLIGGGIGLSTYAYFRQADLDSPTYRAGVMKELAFAALKEIAQHYDSDQVVEYRLLDRAIFHISDPEQRAAFYWRFTHLMNGLNHLENWKEKNVERINSRWNQETFPIQMWYNDQRNITQLNGVVRDQNNMMWWNAAHHYPRRNTGYHLVNGLATVNTVGSIFADIEDRRNLGHMRAIYDTKVAPWNQWRSEEKRAVGKIYESALAVLERQFSEIKSLAA